MAIICAEARNLSPTAFPLPFFTASVVPNNLIVVSVFLNGTFGVDTPLTFTDNVNTGNYINFPDLFSVGNRQSSSAYMVCNASGGPPTLSCPALAGNTVFGNIAIYSGFVNVPTYAGSGSSDYTAVYQNTAGTAQAGTAFNTSKANELVLAFAGNLNENPFATPPASPWNARIANSGVPALFDQIVATAGTTVQLTGTLNATSAWWVMQAGFYDASAAPPPTSYFLESNEYF